MFTDAEPRLSIDEVLTAIARVWDVIEQEALQQATANALAAGFPAADVHLVIADCARRLREGRADRLRTARDMLECGAGSLH